MINRMFGALSGRKDANVATTDQISGGGHTHIHEDWVSPELPVSGDTASHITQPVVEESCRGERSENTPHLQSKLGEMQRTIDHLLAENRGLKVDVQEWQTEAQTNRDRYDREKRRRAEESEEHDRQLRVAREESDSWRRRADYAERENSTMHEEHKRTLDLLQVRTGELVHAQTFLSTTDSVPPAQVISMVDNLNALSSQLASELTECTTFASKKPPPSSPQKEVVERWIGATVVDALVSSSHEEDQTMVQVALSGAISRVAAETITSWSVPGRHDIKLLRRTYGHIFHREPQAVSARWRALAHKSIKEINADIDVVSTRSQVLVDLMRAIVRVSGGAYSERYSAEETMKMVRDIIIMCLDIKRVVTEEIISTNLEVFCPMHGSPFYPTFMEDIDDGDSGKGDSEGDVLIMITNEVGLLRSERPEEGDGQANMHALLKAKVLLAPPT